MGTVVGATGGALTAPDAESRPSRVLAGALLGGAVAGVTGNPRVMRAVGDMWAKGSEVARPLTGSAAEATATLRAKAEKAAIAMAGPAEWVGEKGAKAYTALFDAMGRAKKALTGDDRLFGQSFGYLFTSGDKKPRYRAAAQRVTEIIRGTPEIFDFDLAPALHVVDKAKSAHPEISQEAWDAGYAFMNGTMAVDARAFAQLPEDVRQAFKDYARQRLDGTQVLVENGNIPAEAAQKYATGWTSQADLAAVVRDDELLHRAFGAEVPGANVKARGVNPSTPEQARAIGIDTDPHHAMTLSNFKQSRAVTMSKAIEALRVQATETVAKARELGLATEDGKAMLRTSPLLPPEAFGKTDNLVNMTAARRKAEEAGYVYMAPSDGAFKPYGKAEGWWMARDLRDLMRAQLEFSDNATIATLRRITGISNMANVARISAFIRDGYTNVLKAVAGGVSPFNLANARHYSDTLSVLRRSAEVLPGRNRTGDQAFRALVDTQGAGALWLKELTDELDAPIRAAIKRGVNPHDAVMGAVAEKLKGVASKGRHAANEVMRYKVWIDNYFKVAHALKLSSEAAPSALGKAAERTAVGAGIGALENDEDRLKGALVGGAIGAASMGVLPGRRRGGMTLEAAAREARRYYPAPGFELGILEAGRKMPGSGLGLTYWGGTFRGLKNIALDRPEGFAYIAATLGGASALGDAWGKVTPEERAAANEAHGRFSMYLYRDAAGKARFFDPLGMDVWAPFASALGARGKLEQSRSGVMEAAAEAATSIALAPIVQSSIDAGRAIVEDDPKQLFRHTPLVRPDESKVGAAGRILGTGLTGVVAHTFDTATRVAVGSLSPKKAIFSYIGLSPQAPADERLRALVKYPSGLSKDFGKRRARVLRETESGERTKDNARSTIRSMQETLVKDIERFVRIARESGVPDEAIGAALDEVEIPEEEVK